MASRKRNSAASAKHGSDKHSSGKEQPQLPEPPPFERKVQLHRTQLIGVPLLMLLPLLALFGVFGETSTTERVENGQIAMQVEYVTRYRYKMTNDLRVTVTNLSQQMPITVTVAIDRSYIDRFSNDSFTPNVDQITSDAYKIELKEIEAGGSQVVEVELQGEEYWHHAGMVSASVAEDEPVQLMVGTTIFP